MGRFDYEQMKKNLHAKKIFSHYKYFVAYLYIYI
jgi:hypothetical protein